jgi:hypothetical protein
MTLCLTFLFVFTALIFAAADDDDKASPFDHAPARPVTTMSERYLAGLQSRIQTAANTLSLLQKRFNDNKDDPAAAAEAKPDLDVARSHLHELESRMDAYMLEASRARPDFPDRNTEKRQAPSRSSKRSAPDGSDDEEAYTDGPARPRALPRTLAMPRDGNLDKSGKVNYRI